MMVESSHLPDNEELLLKIIKTMAYSLKINKKERGKRI